MTQSNYTIRTAEAGDRDALATLIRDSTNAYYQERLGADPIFQPDELHTRAGLKPFEFYQGIMIAVPEDGFPKQSTDGLVRSGTVEDIEATAKLEGAPAELMSPTVAPEQLFDTANDPHEINNRAESNDPQHREALIGMRAALAVWEVEMQDQGVFLEPAAIVAPFEKEMHDWFGTPKWHPYKGK